MTACGNYAYVALEMIERDYCDKKVNFFTR